MYIKDKQFVPCLGFWKEFTLQRPSSPTAITNIPNPLVYGSSSFQGAIPTTCTEGDHCDDQRDRQEDVRDWS